MSSEIIANLRDPERDGAPLVSDASDEELLRAIQRAEAKIALPSEEKMRELAARLGPIVTTRGAGAHARRWVAIGAMVGIVASGTVFFRSRLETPSNRVSAPDGPVAAPRIPSATIAASPSQLPPSGEAHDVAAPGISVDAVPAASAPARVRKPSAEPACASEIELVDRADAALRAGDPGGALDLARQHAERCPNGVYVQERERVAIEALARLGRTNEVRARAAPFEKRFPSSPHLRRIRSLAEGDPR